MNSKINIVNYVHTWLPQTEIWIYNQLKFSLPQINPFIVCERLENLDQFKLPGIFCLSKEKPFNYIFEKILQKAKLRRHLSFLIENVKQLDAQILHSHFGNWGWMNVGAAKEAQVRHVITFYGFDVNMLPSQNPIWNKRYLELFEQADLFLCEGPHMAKCIMALGCPEQKIKIQHLGINVNEITYKPRVWQSQKPLRVLIAASFQEKKGIPFALEALGKLKSKLALEITIIGDANSERKSLKEKTKILNTIKNLNLCSNVRLLGYQPYSILLKEAYAHHIFLSPSVMAHDGDSEGGAPVTLLDMMATGMPVISTYHCDIPGIVQHGRTGLLAREHTIDDIMNQFEWLIKNHTTWSSLTDQARLHVEQNFNVIKQSEKLALIYRELLS